MNTVTTKARIKDKSQITWKFTPAEWTEKDVIRLRRLLKKHEDAGAGSSVQWSKRLICELHAKYRITWKKLFWFSREYLALPIDQQVRAAIRCNWCVLCRKRFVLDKGTVNEWGCSYCERKHPEVVKLARRKVRAARAKATTLKKYGYEFVSQVPEIKAKLLKSMKLVDWKKARRKAERTNLKRYGVKAVTQNPKIAAKVSASWRAKPKEEIEERTNKSRETYFKKTGYTSPAKNPKVIKKSRETYRKRTGYDHNMHNPESIARLRATVQEKYGVDHPIQNEEIKNRVIRTHKERYGGLGKGGNLRAKIEKTTIERYGYPVAQQNPEIMERTYQTNLERYGSRYAMQNPDVALRSLKNGYLRRDVQINGRKYTVQGSAEEELLRLLLSRGYKVKTQFSSGYPRNKADEIGTIPDFYVQSPQGERFFVECKSTWTFFGPNNEWLKINRRKARDSQARWYVKVRGKFTLLPRDWYETLSKVELKEILKEGAGVRACANRLKKRGLSVTKLKSIAGFKVQQLLVATLSGSTRSELTRVIEKAGQKGMHPLLFWRHELHEHPVAVESILHSRLGLSKNKVFARKCVVKAISTKEARVFLNAYHLQQNTSAPIKLGLFHASVLVAVATFRRPIATKKHDWELARFCVKANWSVPGAGGKLISAFRKQHVGSLVSYADRRWSQGALYESLGFEKVGESKPGYFYEAPDGTRVLRYKAQKHKLPKLLGMDFDPKLSETENMINAGFRKVYDAGQLTYVLK